MTRPTNARLPGLHGALAVRAGRLARSRTRIIRNEMAKRYDRSCIDPGADMARLN